MIPKYIREAREFAVAADWWKKWCDYVNIEFKTLTQLENENSQNLANTITSPQFALEITKTSEITNLINYQVEANKMTQKSK